MKSSWLPEIMYEHQLQAEQQLFKVFPRLLDNPAGFYTHSQNFFLVDFLCLLPSPAVANIVPSRWCDHCPEASHGFTMFRSALQPRLWSSPGSRGRGGGGVRGGEGGGGSRVQAAAWGRRREPGFSRSSAPIANPPDVVAHHP